MDGWHYDEDTGAMMRDVIYHMGRRCHNRDYSGRGEYLITMTLADRAKPILGRLVGDKMELSAIGAAIDAHIRRIGEFTP